MSNADDEAVKILELKMHETINVGENFDSYKILRVHGGWIYTYMRLDKGAMTSVFVPLKKIMK